jgi:putative membrane protein
VAVESAGVPLSLPHLLGAVGVAAAVGFVAVPLLGDRYLIAVGRMDPRRLSGAVLVGLGVLSWLFAGYIGVAAYVAAAVVGLVPARFGARRANLMGVLIGPIVVG